MPESRFPRGPVILAVAAVASFGVGAVVTASEYHVRQSTAADEQRIDHSSARIESPDASDPRGGPPWAIQEYRTADGKSCAKPGRRVGSRVGSLLKNGEIAGTDIQEGGLCRDVEGLPESAPVGWHISSEIQDARTGKVDPVSFVWGFVRPEVERVKIETALGTRTAPVTPGHTFIAVFRGRVAIDGATFTAYRSDGSTATVVAAAPPPEIREQMLNPPGGEALRRELAEADRRQDDPSYHGQTP